MTKSNLTLTQSGLLAVLLQPQRHKVIKNGAREVSTSAAKSVHAVRQQGALQ